MPYIPQIRRARAAWAPASEGELNFLITREIRKFLGDTPNYAAYNSVIGVLECAKMELYRRQVALYEDVKMKENGDVYEGAIE